jgi:hypothetical protein
MRDASAVRLAAVFAALCAVEAAVAPRRAWRLRAPVRARSIVAAAPAQPLPLEELAARFKMEIFDLDEGIIGLDSRDSAFGIRVVGSELERQPGGSLGIELVEMAASSSDTRGLVLVANAESARVLNQPAGSLLPGDAICAVGPLGGELARVEGLNYDETVEAIGRCADSPRIKIVSKRLVRRETVTVRVELPDGSTQAFDALAGANLRMLLLARDVRLYDPRTRRFDQPYARGDCAGEGLCGTCLAAVVNGSELLSKPDSTERLLLKNRPASWRAACRVVVGADNAGGEVGVRLSPQSAFEDEL